MFDYDFLESCNLSRKSQLLKVPQHPNVQAKLLQSVAAIAVTLHNIKLLKNLAHCLKIFPFACKNDVHINHSSFLIFFAFQTVTHSIKKVKQDEEKKANS